jgi:hypothetical protein
MSICFTRGTYCEDMPTDTSIHFTSEADLNHLWASLQGLHAAVLPRKSEIIEQLSVEMQNLIIRTAENILNILQSVEELFREQDALPVLSSQLPSRNKAPVTSLSILTEDAEKKTKSLRRDLRPRFRGESG